MLNLFRQGGFMKVLMSGVVILIAAAFIFDFRGGGDASGDDCVVRVDTSCVPAKDYNFLMRLVPPQGATNKQLKAAGFALHAANALVERELLLKEARRLGVEVNEEDVDSHLATGRVHFSWPVDAPLPQAMFAGRPFPVTGALDPISYIRVNNSKTGDFDYNIYKRSVRGILRMSPKEFKKLQRDEITASRVRGLVTSGVRVSEEDAFSQFELNRSRVTVRYAEIKDSWFGRAGGDISDAAADSADTAAVDAAWETAKAQWTEGCPLVSEVLLRFPPGADAEQRSEQNARAEDVSKLLKDKVPFETVARVYSDAPNANTGGELGCLTKSYGPVAEELLKGIERLEAGSVSDPIESAQGFHIIKYHGELLKEDMETKGRRAVGRRVAAVTSAKDRAKAFASAIIKTGQSGKSLEGALDEAIASAVTLQAPERALEGLAEVLKVRGDAPQMTVSRPFNRTAISVPGLKDTSVASSVFDLEKDDDWLPEPVEAFAGQVVIQLKEKDLATREQFDEDKAELLRGLQDQKRADAISSYLSRLRGKAQKIEINQATIGAGESKDDDNQHESSETNSG